jgi:hypothetical protein
MIWPPRQRFALDRPPPGTPINPDELFGLGLAACWPMWEGAGQRWEDAAGAGAHMISTSNVSATSTAPWGAWGDFGPLPIFTGAQKQYGQAASIPTILQQQGAHFFLECWFVINNTTGTFALIGFGTSGPLLRVNAGKMEFLRSGVTNLLNGVTTAAPGVLHHSMAGFSCASSVTASVRGWLFLDGNLEATGDWGGAYPFSYGGPLTLGADAGGSFLDGIIVRAAYYLLPQFQGDRPGPGGTPPVFAREFARPENMWAMFRPPRASRGRPAVVAAAPPFPIFSGGIFRSRMIRGTAI